MNARQLLSRFETVKKTANGWDVPCPTHADSKPSLSIADGTKGVLLHCHAGCTAEDIVAALNMKMADLLNDAPAPAITVPKVKAAPASDKPKSTVYKGQHDHGIAATYDYTDVDGTLLFQVVRKIGSDGKKTFLQRRPDPSKPGDWIWKVAKQVKRVPYRLPDLLAVDTVFVVEGEKDVNRLWHHGVPATCNAGGAGKWGASEAKALAAACVQRAVIIPDNDEPGHKHAQDVAAKCKKAGLAVSVVNLPGLAHHGDVSDWLDTGGTKDGLLALAAVPYVLPAPGKAATPPGYSGPVCGSGSPAPDAVPAPSYTVELETTTGDLLALSDPTKYAPPSGDGIPYDVGAAQAFADRCGDRVRYDHARGEWFMWTGHYWKPDAGAEIHTLAMQHVAMWRNEAANALHYPKRHALSAFLLKLDRKAAIENMLTCATWLDPIRTDGKLWDQHPMLFGVRNGVIDLATGALIAGQKTHYITQIADVVYDAAATAPRWEQFMSEVFMDDVSLITYVNMAVGYSLTSDMREQAFFLCVGTGANGKSIFLDTLEHVFGDYGHRANMSVFTGDAAKFHLAEMKGKRLITASETKANTRINEDVMKNFTGGETQSAEKKGGQPFTFKPVGKIWMGVNHEPKVADDSYGFWRRVRLIPFLRTFAGASEDRNLRDKLRAEAPGILRWCVEGCIAWRDMGLVTPAKVLNATERYQAHENPLSEFFAEKCQYDDEAVTSTSALIAAYTTWCDDQGIRAYDRLPRRSILTQLEKQFTIVNIAGMNRVKGIKVIGQGLF